MIELLYENDSFNLEGLQSFVTLMIMNHVFLRLFLFVSIRQLWYSFPVFLNIVANLLLYCVYVIILKLGSYFIEIL